MRGGTGKGMALIIHLAYPVRSALVLVFLPRLTLGLSRYNFKEEYSVRPAFHLVCPFNKV